MRQSSCNATSGIQWHTSEYNFIYEQQNKPKQVVLWTSSGMATLFNRLNPAHHWQPCAINKLMFAFSEKQTLVQKVYWKFPKKLNKSRKGETFQYFVYTALRPLDELVLALFLCSFFQGDSIAANAFSQSRWRLFPQTPAEGASITVYAAAASEMEGVGGCYLYNGEKRASAESSYDAKLQTKLWKTSCELVGIKSA